MSTPRAAVVLLFAVLLAMLPAALWSDWNGTEGRRVEIAAEMVRTGDLVVPTLYFEPTFAKPPLHYWILGAVQKAFGSGFLAMRAPSMVAVWALAVLAFALHRRWFGAPAAWIAALGVSTSPLVVAHFSTAEIDPVFACLTASSLWLLAVGVARDRRGLLLAAGVLGGAALLHKGPPYLLFAAGAWLAWLRHRRLRGFAFYALPLVVLPAAWVFALTSSPAVAQAASSAAGVETVGRFLGHTWQDLFEVPLFVARAVLVQAPLVFWCFWEHRSQRDARMSAEDLTLRMCSGAAVLAVFLLAFFPERSTRYLLPNMPLFTFAVAPAVAHYALRASKLGHVAHGLVRALAVVGALGLIALPWISGPVPPRTPILALVLALAPLWLRTPKALVAACLWLPLLAGWTVLGDFRDRAVAGSRATFVHGSSLERELRRLGATESTIEVYGHVKGGLVLGAGLLPRGQEYPKAEPKARFLLLEAAGLGALPARPNYEERLRLCAGRDTWIVEERKDAR